MYRHVKGYAHIQVHVYTHSHIQAERQPWSLSPFFAFTYIQTDEPTQTITDQTTCRRGYKHMFAYKHAYMDTRLLTGFTYMHGWWTYCHTTMACRYVCFTGVCILDIHQIHRIFMIIYVPPSWNAGIECIFPHASSAFSIPATVPLHVKWKLLFQVLGGSPAGFNCKQFGHRSRDCPEPPDEAWAYRLPV